MSLKITQSTRFKRDIKKMKKQGRPITELKTLVAMLTKKKPLPENIRTIALVETTLIIENVIFNLTGY